MIRVPAGQLLYGDMAHAHALVKVQRTGQPGSCYCVPTPDDTGACWSTIAWRYGTCRHAKVEYWERVRWPAWYCVPIPDDTGACWVSVRCSSPPRDRAALRCSARALGAGPTHSLTPGRTRTRAQALGGRYRRRPGRVQTGYSKQSAHRVQGQGTGGGGVPGRQGSSQGPAWPPISSHESAWK